MSPLNEQATVAGRISPLWWAVPLVGAGLVLLLAGLVLRLVGADGPGISPVMTSVGVACCVAANFLWRRGTTRRHEDERIVATGRRAELTVVAVESAGGVIKTNGRVTRLKQHLAFDLDGGEPVWVRGVWLPPGTQPGYVATIAYDEAGRAGVLLENPRVQGQVPPPAAEQPAAGLWSSSPAPAQPTESTDQLAKKIGLGGD
jgi:hypothetical protein